MRDDLVIYASDQAHSSIGRAARTLGFRPDQVRVLPVGDDLRLEPATLAAAMAADDAAGRLPFLVVANGGATSTGAVDPLARAGRALPGARTSGCTSTRRTAASPSSPSAAAPRSTGSTLADSITLDPHKWLYQPYECGCLLVRDGRALRRAFEITSDYLRDAEADDGIVNFADHGLQLTRTSRAFKLWLSLRTFGVDAFRAAIDRTLDLAELACERIEASDALELVAPPSLGIVCFRRADGRRATSTGSSLRSRRAASASSPRRASTAAPACASASSTTRRGRTTSSAVLDFLETAEPVAAGGGIRPARRCAEHACRSSRGSSAAEVARRRTAARSERRVAAGETVVERWDTTP